MKSQKLQFTIEGISWVYLRTETPDEILTALYKGPTYCQVRANSNNELRGNVYGPNNTILGFLSDLDFLEYEIRFHSMENPECLIEKNENFNSDAAFATLTLKEATQEKGIKRTKRPPYISQKPVTSSQIFRPKHPITKKAFSPRKDPKKFFSTLEGTSGIYCIYSNRFTTYIGQSKDIGARLKKHFRDLTAGKHHNRGLQSDWQIFGANKFTFHLVELCDLENLDDRETYYIEEYATHQFGYNATPDGQGIQNLAAVNPLEFDNYRSIHSKLSEASKAQQKNNAANVNDSNLNRLAVQETPSVTLTLTNVQNTIRNRVEDYYDDDPNTYFTNTGDFSSHSQRGNSSIDKQTAPKKCNFPQDSISETVTSIKRTVSTEDMLETPTIEPRQSFKSVTLKSKPITDPIISSCFDHQKRANTKKTKSDKIALYSIQNLVSEVEKECRRSSTRLRIFMYKLSSHRFFSAPTPGLKRLQKQLNTVAERLSRSKPLLVEYDYNILDERLTKLRNRIQ